MVYFFTSIYFNSYRSSFKYINIFLLNLSITHSLLTLLSQRVSCEYINLRNYKYIYILSSIYTNAPILEFRYILK